jgi:catechol 2,3-dioxygenase-like lactoylglutathione lyase family enzyme
MPNAGLSHHILRINEPGRSLAFYRERLGMALIEQQCSPDEKETCYRLAFPATQDTHLELRHRADVDPAVGYQHSRGDLYWKIGITLPDVDLARESLIAAGVAVGEARQFRDIGYLCHLADPDGFQIELLQHRFQQNHRPSQRDPALPLGCPAGFGQITIRVKDPELSIGFYETLGMRLLSLKPVEPYGFTLYFLASSDERPPHPDLEAAENREWLWQRPYPTLELQHRWGDAAPDGPYRTHDAQPLGFAGLAFTCGDLEARVAALQAEGLSVVVDQGDAQITDPDGTRIWLLTAAT